VVWAVLGAPGFLSGLDEAQFKEARRRAEQRFAAQLAAQRDAGHKVLGHIDSAQRSFGEYTAEQIAIGNTPHAKAVAKVRGLGAAR
jgi:hypothetical protein